MIPLPLLNIGTRLVSNVLDRVLPEKMDEKEREETKLKALVVTQELMVKKVAQEISDTVSARELAAAQAANAPMFIRVLRGLIRPLIGLFCALVWGWTIIAPYLGHPRIELTTFDYSILLSVFAFYFGLRTAEKFKDSQNKG